MRYVVEGGVGAVLGFVAAETFRWPHGSSEVVGAFLVLALMTGISRLIRPGIEVIEDHARWTGDR